MKQFTYRCEGNAIEIPIPSQRLEKMLLKVAPFDIGYNGQFRQISVRVNTASK